MSSCLLPSGLTPRSRITMTCYYNSVLEVLLFILSVPELFDVDAPPMDVSGSSAMVGLCRMVDGMKTRAQELIGD